LGGGGEFGEDVVCVAGDAADGGRREAALELEPDVAEAGDGGRHAAGLQRCAVGRERGGVLEEGELGVVAGGEDECVKRLARVVGPCDVLVAELLEDGSVVGVAGADGGAVATVIDDGVREPGEPAAERRGVESGGLEPPVQVAAQWPLTTRARRGMWWRRRDMPMPRV
jgi:hypothetical protein